MKLAVFSIYAQQVVPIIGTGPRTACYASWQLIYLDGHTQHFIEIMLLVNQIKVKSVCMKS